MMPAAEPLSSTLPFTRACDRLWDVLVVGAGPGGAMAARELARHKASVLLVDKASFPRRKVCGCYLNGSALAILSRAGLETLTREHSAPRVAHVRLGSNRRVAELPLPPGAALSRETLDTALVTAAIRAGAQFLSGTEAKAGDAHDQYREATLRRAGENGVVLAKITIVADGVRGHFMRERGAELEYRTAPNSLVGASAVTDRIPSRYQPGTIQMAIGPGGYVGCLQVENGQLDIAAAFLPPRLRKSDGPGDLAQRIADQSGLPLLEGLRELNWIGTPPLSSVPTVLAGQRFFLIGDAAGYVEPFTGEGIAWATAAGLAVAPLIRAAVDEYSPEMIHQWRRSHRNLLGLRQLFCSWLTRSLRYPRLAQSGVAVLSRCPGIAYPFVRLLNKVP